MARPTKGARPEGIADLAVALEIRLNAKRVTGFFE
jgi:hypothetical protein